jgi:hypothetical protein
MCKTKLKIGASGGDLTVLDDRTVGAAHGTTLIGKHARVASLMSAVIDESSLLALIEWHLTTRTGPCSVLCIQ